MNPIIARSVVPASMHIDKPLLAGWKMQMAISLIHKPTGSLPLEIEDDVGECFPLKDVFIDIEGAGTDIGSGRMHLKRIMTGPLPLREVSRPVDLGLPRVDFSSGLEARLENCFSRIN